MKRRLAAAMSVASLGTLIVSFAVVHAALPLTPTILGSGYPTPIGIDWLSTTNQLLISDNWSTGIPNNFETVSRAPGGAHAVWGTQSGFTDEIYFATVRPGQPGGWVVGDVFSGKGAGDTVHLAHFDQSGAPVGGGNFGTLTGETRLKRGGITFDRIGVPGLNGDLVVVASNDINFGNTAGVWKIDSSGNATEITELNAHAEGVAVIPNNPAYGPWAGKILVGEEGTVPPTVEAIDPVTGTHVAYNVGGVRVEDIWVIPADSDFYGVDNAEGGPSKIWTIPASDWSSNGLVGKVLLAQEHQASLYTAEWNGTTFVITTVSPYSGSGPLQYEHITFAPVVHGCARISIAPNGTNEVGQSHTFTATLEKDLTCSGTFVPASGEAMTITLTPSNGSTPSPAGPFNCTTNAAGQCSVTFTSPTPGVVTGQATSTLTVSGTTLTVTTGTPANGPNAVKTFVDANIQITPQTATNPVSTNHTLTGHVNVNNGSGSGYVNAPNGTVISFSLTNSGGASASFVGPSSCTTAGGTGSCTVVISSPTAGTTTIKAATNVTVGGVALHRETGDTHEGDSPDATKIWQPPPGVCLPPNPAFGLGAGGAFTVLGKTGANVIFGSGETLIFGDVGIGPNDTGSLIKATINGKLFLDPTAHPDIHDDLKVTGGTFTQNLTAAVTAADAASTNLAGKPATPFTVNGGAPQTTPVTMPDVASTTITLLSPGLNVIPVTSVNTHGAITIVGSASQQVVFDVSGGFTCNGCSIGLSGGITPQNVLWNFVGTGADVSISKPVGSAVGIFLAPNRNILLDKASVTGALIGAEGGLKLLVHSGAQLICPK